jgi:hypothetical protein
MNIPELKAMLQRRIVYLGQIRNSAVAIGDIVQIDRIDAELAETQSTLNQLEALL